MQVRVTADPPESRDEREGGPEGMRVSHLAPPALRSSHSCQRGASLHASHDILFPHWQFSLHSLVTQFVILALFQSKGHLCS